MRRLTVPVVILIFALVSCNQIDQLTIEQQRLLSLLPYLTLGISLIFSFYYNRARLFTLSLIFIFIYHLIQKDLQVSLAELPALQIYILLSLAVPLTSSLLLLFPERGLMNRYGLLVLSTVPIQLLIATFILNVIVDAFINLSGRFYTTNPFDNFVLPLNISVVYLITFIGTLFLLYQRYNETLMAILFAGVIGFITFAWFHVANISIVMFSTAGLIFIVSMMQSSFDMAYRDDLTGLLGRRALNEKLKGLGKQYAIAMMDVDHFKKFNDTYGHDVGDDVLKVVATKIGEVEGGGIPYRYGGEEFCVVFNGKDVEYAKPYLEDVRLNIECYKMALRDTKHRPKKDELVKERRGRRLKSRGGKTVSVTISIGVSAPDENTSKPEAILKKADQALYKAKQNGRNCLETN